MLSLLSQHTPVQSYILEIPLFLLLNMPRTYISHLFHGDILDSIAAASFVHVTPNIDAWFCSFTTNWYRELHVGSLGVEIGPYLDS
jgi:hypothetical protein